MGSATGKRFILCSAFITLSLLFCAGQSSGTTLRERIGNHNLRNYREEISLTTDRAVYITGEQVWISLHRLNALSHSPQVTSRVIYVELLDRNNIPVSQVKTSVGEGSASAVITLPDNIGSGSYLLRAYTLWMQNFPEVSFCNRSISVINPFEAVEHLPALAAGRTADSIQAYPEGGSLIPGRMCRVAIRTFDKGGNPVAATAAIIRNSADTVARSSTNENGCGLAEFRVNSNDSYILACRAATGRVRTFLLPRAEQGWGVRTEAGRQDQGLLVTVLKGNTGSRGERINIEIVSAGTIVQGRQLMCTGDTTVSFRAGQLPSGLSLAVVADQDGKPLAGRYFYLPSLKKLNLTAELSQASYLPREKVHLSVGATDNTGKPVAADLCISVVKTAVAGKELYQELTGLPANDRAILGGLSVREINDYLAGLPADLSGLTELRGESSKSFRYMPELEGHQVRGSVKIKETGEPLRNTDISLSFVGKTAKCQFGRTDDKGEFNFLISEDGVSEIVIQPVSPEITGCYTEIDQPFSDTYSRQGLLPFRPDTSILAGLNNAIISAQVAGIYETSGAEKANGRSRELPDFFGKAETTIKMADYIELTTLREVVKEILPNVYTVKQNGKYDFRLINKFRGQPFTNIPLILVDGVPIYDFEKVLNINSKDIDKADIINTRYFYSRVVFDGIVSFVSKKGDLSAIEFDNKIFRQIYEGCQLPFSFRSPDYTDIKLRNGRIPDFRNTLYWTPSLMTGSDGKAAADFFTSDESESYVIKVEGLGPDGSRGFVTLPLPVRQK